MFQHIVLNPLEIVHRLKFLYLKNIHNYIQLPTPDQDNSSNDDQPPVELLHLVAKMRPSSEEFLEIFQIDITFVKEAAVYLKIVPSLLALQREQGFDGDGELIDVFCRCFNARVSLDPTVEKVDQDGVMLFENLKLAGYVTADRRKGFNRELARYVLKVRMGRKQRRI